MQKNIAWEELTWQEIKVFAEEDAIVIIPVASIEQHGPHLPVSTDSIIVSTIARRVAESMAKKGAPVLVAPTVWMGNSLHHMLFPGTISMDYSGFATVLTQICSCIKHHGFSRIVLLNGHGGNEYPLKVVVTEINQNMGKPVFVISYWDAAKDEMANILETQKSVRHSCEAETSIMLVLRPELVGPFDTAIGPDHPDPVELTSGFAYTFRTYKDRTKIGVIGNATSSTREKGELILEAVTGNLVEFLTRQSLWEITL